MATKPVVGTESGDGAGVELPASDIRSAPVLPSGIQVRALGRRSVSVAALVLLDLAGLSGALYLALVLRELYRGTKPLLWGLLWSTEENWLAFLTLVTILVFWQAGLYAPRERRAGAGRIVSSLLLITVITVIFSVGTGYQHSTFGLYVTAFVLSAIAIVLLRSSYEVVTADLFSADLERASFDAIVLGDVIEHLISPADALVRIRALLAPGGVVWLAVPDAGSAVARVLGKRWWSVIPTHVQYFTRGSLATLLARCGFDQREVSTAPKAFTVGYYVERVGGYSPAAGRVLARAATTAGIAERMWAPDFRDRMAVVARVKSSGAPVAEASPANASTLPA